jgi:hypothetical protein
MIRTTAPLAAALLTLLLAGTTRADFIYTFTTTAAAPNGGGSLNGSFTESTAVVQTGFISIAQATAVSFTLSNTANPFFNQTYTQSDFTGADGIYPIPVDKTTGAFNYMSGQSTTLHFTKAGEDLSLIITQLPPSSFEVSLGGENPTDGSGAWTVTQTTSVVPAPSSMVLAILGGACGFVGGVCRRLRRKQGNQQPQPQS